MIGRVWGTFNRKRFIQPSDLFFKPFEEHLSGIRNIQCSNNHILCLGTKKNETKQWAYALGINQHGECGRHDKDIFFLPVSMQVEKETLESIGDIYTGRTQSFVVDETRQRVYASGLNDYGQLGIPDAVGTNVMKLNGIETLNEALAKRNHQVQMIVNKGSFTFVLTQHQNDPSDQGLYASGANYHHEVNHMCKSYASFKDLLPYYRKYTPELNDIEIGEISCGNTHMVLLSRCGERLFSRGRGKEGQLGTPKHEKDNPMHAIHFIEHEPLDEPIHSLKSGFHYNVAIGKQTGHLYRWGSGLEGHMFWGNAAHGQRLAKANSHPIRCIYNASPVETVSAGSQHLLFKTTNQLFSYGTGFDGELGNGDQNQEIDHPLNITSIVAGDCQELPIIFAGDGFSGCLGQLEN